MVTTLFMIIPKYRETLALYIGFGMSFISVRQFFWASDSRKIGLMLDRNDSTVIALFLEWLLLNGLWELV